MALSRQHPFFSPIGCLGGFVLILGIVLAVIFSGGAIFSPGVLTAFAAKGTPLKGFVSHADFQNDCRQCHAPLQGVTPERCEACHVEVGAERAGGTGLHGKLQPEASARCETCHRDHKGPDLDPNETALKKFDHMVMGFSLARHIVNYDQSPLKCAGCHTGAKFALDEPACVKCHGDHNASFMLEHMRAFRPDCRACHDGVDEMHDFDHAQTQFALEGRHAGLGCADCHSPEVAAADTPVECAACHAEPPMHAGVFDDDCAACHTPDAWLPVKLEDRPNFTHARLAFQLVNHRENYDGTPLTCRTCHTGTGNDFSYTAQTCTDCHTQHDAAFMTQHIQERGSKCVNCHDGAGNMKGFDHNRVFVLDGRHAAVQCLTCHVEEKFRGTPSECVACHGEPEIHAGLFGTDCAACHTTTAWAPAMLTQHTFPLDHGEQGEIACAVCHTESYVTYTCYGCHEHEPAETQRQHAKVDLVSTPLNDCAACHPTGRKEEGGD
jgi:hypothetical protein